MQKSHLNTILAFFCLLLILCSVYSIFFNGSSHENDVTIDKGFLDLSKRDFFQEGAVYLDGAWAFYPNQFISPQNKETIPVSYLKVPGPWNNFFLNGTKIGADAYGTYRLKVLVGENREMLGLKLPSMSSCYRLYINGKLVNQNGVPGTSREEEIPQWKPDIAFFTPDSPELDIVVHVSNFHHAKGGIWGHILLGSQQEIINFRELNLMRSFLLFGVLVITAVFMLSLSLIEKNFPCLYLGLFCLFSAFREIAVREVALWNIIGNISFNFLARLEYITMPLGIISYTMFIYNIYKKDLKTKAYLALFFFPHS